MIPVKQTKVVVLNSKNEMVVRGNCFPAAIASILELSIDEVPNVETLYDIDGSFWLVVMETFLKKKGFELGGNEQFKIAFHRDIIDYNFDPALLDKSLKYCKDKYYLVAGMTVRGFHHVVIYQNGKMVHDPHPTNEGLTTLETFEEIIKL